MNQGEGEEVRVQSQPYLEVVAASQGVGLEIGYGCYTHFVNLVVVDYFATDLHN